MHRDILILLFRHVEDPFSLSQSILGACIIESHKFTWSISYFAWIWFVLFYLWVVPKHLPLCNEMFFIQWSISYVGNLRGYQKHRFALFHLHWGYLRILGTFHWTKYFKRKKMHSTHLLEHKGTYKVVQNHLLKTKKLSRILWIKHWRIFLIEKEWK